MNEEMVSKQIDLVLNTQWARDRATHADHNQRTCQVYEEFAGEVPNGTWFGIKQDMLRGGVMGSVSNDPTLIRFSGHLGPGLVGVRSRVWVRRWIEAEPCECSTCQQVRDRQAFKSGTLQADPAAVAALEGGSIDQAPRRTALVDDKKPADVAKARRLEELREKLGIDSRDWEGTEHE